MPSTSDPIALLGTREMAFDGFVDILGSLSVGFNRVPHGLLSNRRGFVNLVMP